MVFWNYADLLDDVGCETCMLNNASFLQNVLLCEIWERLDGFKFFKNKNCSEECWRVIFKKTFKKIF